MANNVDNSYTGTDYLGVGSTKASSGSIRLPNQGDIKALNAAGDANIYMFYIGADDKLVIGLGSAANAQIDIGNRSMDNKSIVIKAQSSSDDVTLIATAGAPRLTLGNYGSFKATGSGTARTGIESASGRPVGVAYTSSTFDILSGGLGGTVVAQFSDSGLSVAGNVVSRVTTNAQTGTSYTLVLADASKLVELSNAAAITLTVPPNSSVAFPVGTKIDLLQTNTGQVTVAQGSGVTVNGAPGLKLTGRWSAATLIKRATDTWVLVGDLAA